MKKDEFWKLYKEKYEGKIQAGVAISDGPLGSDCGIFVFSCFQNEKGVWCLEKTRERCNTPYHEECANEDEAFEKFLSIVHSHSTLDDFYIRQQDSKRMKFEKNFMEQIEGETGMYVYTKVWPGTKTVYTYKMTCCKTDSGKWKLETDNGDGEYSCEEYDTLEEAREAAYRKF